MNSTEDALKRFLNRPPVQSDKNNLSLLLKLYSATIVEYFNNVAKKYATTAETMHNNERGANNITNSAEWQRALTYREAARHIEHTLTEALDTLYHY
ncbi:hypothetical protein [Faecalicoccus pleomorphus]|uniref:hypothetical protein n=1 Tax=Faecalicoccus pleomorphus TaxID=1323 RepID=UPI0022E91E18|nr:hypothetical protein [Faecalicoccus pleomorphus]